MNLGLLSRNVQVLRANRKNMGVEGDFIELLMQAELPALREITAKGGGEL